MTARDKEKLAIRTTLSFLKMASAWLSVVPATLHLGCYQAHDMLSYQEASRNTILYINICTILYIYISCMICADSFLLPICYSWLGARMLYTLGPCKWTPGHIPPPPPPPPPPKLFLIIIIILGPGHEASKHTHVHGTYTIPDRASKDKTTSSSIAITVMVPKSHLTSCK